MFGHNPASRHVPPNKKASLAVCPECKGAKYIGPILGICPCPRGCATVAEEDEVWTEQERIERLAVDERSSKK